MLRLSVVELVDAEADTIDANLVEERFSECDFGILCSFTLCSDAFSFFLIHLATLVLSQNLT